MKILNWRLIPFVMFVGLAVFFWRGLSLDPQNLPSAHLGKPLPEFRLVSLVDPSSQLTASSLKGHITLLNVWASWCEACTDEQAFLMNLAKQGVLIYGLNYKDNPLNAKEWLETWGNPYQLVGEDIHGRVAIDLGVYGAPETFLIDKAGIILYRHVGVLNSSVWQQEFLPRIKQLEQSA